MIKVIFGSAPEYEFLDGQWWDTIDTLEARRKLRAKIEAWNRNELSTQYPPIQIYREFKEGEDMIAYMMFDTAEEAALFKLQYL